MLEVEKLGRLSAAELVGLRPCHSRAGDGRDPRDAIVCEPAEHGEHDVSRPAGHRAGTRGGSPLVPAPGSLSRHPCPCFPLPGLRLRRLVRGRRPCPARCRRGCQGVCRSLGRKVAPRLLRGAAGTGRTRPGLFRLPPGAVRLLQGPGRRHLPVQKTRRCLGRRGQRGRRPGEAHGGHRRGLSALPGRRARRLQLWLLKAPRDPTASRSAA
mmetsp:Transcript_69815/g.185548  ORF Transcript_69815/g.185548 Transcript_69815/m.185548 type:complete len:211 (+) Transcript_69815:1236-1868(+)